MGPQGADQPGNLDETSSFRRVAGHHQVRAPEPASPDFSAETSDVWKEVHRLPRRQQQAIALHYVAQLSMAEMADVMGCSQGAVKSHLHRARETLRGPLSAWTEEEL